MAALSHRPAKELAFACPNCKAPLTADRERMLVTTSIEAKQKAGFMA